MFLEEVLCPALQAGDVVVMDNLSAPKVQGVGEWIAEKSFSELVPRVAWAVLAKEEIYRPPTLVRNAAT